jgi:hypothetical protein
MMPIRHYYHVYAGGAWSAPLRRHFASLARYRLRTDMTVGLVGEPGDRDKAREMVTLRARDREFPPPVRWLEADEGFEQLTLRQVHQDVREIPGDFAVLYAHTKGAYVTSESNALWNWSVTRELVGEWQHCVELLGSHDMVGCHWVKSVGKEHPGQPMIFGGNFWWATAAYLRRLPLPRDKTRWDAEDWISLGNPKVYDMLPGWPDY